MVTPTPLLDNGSTGGNVGQKNTILSHRLIPSGRKHGIALYDANHTAFTRRYNELETTLFSPIVGFYPTNSSTPSWDSICLQECSDVQLRGLHEVN